MESLFLVKSKFHLINKDPTKTKIRNVQPKLLDNDHIFTSSVVSSLFTNVPLNRTLNIILSKPCLNENLEKGNFRKRAMKLIKNTFGKTLFNYEICSTTWSNLRCSLRSGKKYPTVLILWDILRRLPKHSTSINISSFFFSHCFRSRFWIKYTFVTIFLEFRQKETPELFRFYLLKKTRTMYMNFIKLIFNKNIVKIFALYTSSAS